MNELNINQINQEQFECLDLNDQIELVQRKNGYDHFSSVRIAAALEATSSDIETTLKYLSEF